MTTSPGEAAAAPSLREPFWNLPNTITLLRGFAVPLLLLLPLFPGPSGSRMVAWGFILAATTDVVDGWLAAGASRSRPEAPRPPGRQAAGHHLLVVLWRSDRIGWCGSSWSSSSGAS
jgi:hypothetical protein